MTLRLIPAFSGVLLSAGALVGCNASDSLAPASTAPAPQSSYAEAGDRLVLEGGVSVTMADERVQLRVPGGETLLSPAEALALAQASAYAGAALAVDGRVGFFPSWFPPPVCDPPGEVMWGCSFSFQLDSDTWEQLGGEEGLPLMEGESELAYAFGFYHAQGSESRLQLTNGVEIALEGEGVYLLAPEGRADFSPAEALALAQASAYAGAALAVDGRVGFFPSWFPPPVCDPPGEVMWGCSFSFEASQEMWDQLRGGEGPPLLEGSGDLDYNFGFLYRAFEEGEFPFEGR